MCILPGNLIRLQYFTKNFGTFKFSFFFVVNDKSIDVHTCRKFDVMIFLCEISRFKIKLFCVFYVYPVIYPV